MNSVKLQFDYFVSNLIPIYGIIEAKSIAFLYFEEKYKLSKTDILTDKTSEIKYNFNDDLKRLLNHEPVQYILGKAHFFGLEFFVNSHTLIPRNETEELVEKAINFLHQTRNNNKNVSVLDIGTGSGCIPISIAKNIENIQIKGWDISENAIIMANNNNILNGTNVDFEIQDILEKNLKIPKKFDLITSNPPYVTYSEMATINKNVLDYEPSLALFVPDTDSLLFYKKIADFAINHLTPEGGLLIEINEKYGFETKVCLENKGFNLVELFTDIHGKDRIILAKKN